MMLSVSGPFRYAGNLLWPAVCYLFPTVCVVMESRPRYWRVEVHWLWWTVGVEWEGEP
jgi:hypothetical protein